MNVEEYEQRLRQRVGEAEYGRHKDIHTEFRALNIEVPTTVEKNTEAFASFLGDLSDEGETKGTKESTDR